MAISVSQIEILLGKLEKLPKVENPDRKISGREAVAMMATSIRDLQSRGYSIEKIAEILRESGLEIAPTTLKSYLTKVKVTPSRSKSRTSQKTRNDSDLNKKDDEKNASEKPEAPSRMNDQVDGKKKLGGTTISSGSFVPKEDSHEI